MTGYAVITRETSGGTLTIEMKSVNSRFLDLQFRINDDLRTLEPALREAIMARVTRGKVECRLSFGRKAGAASAAALNSALLSTLAALQADVRKQFPEAPALTVNELLRWPGVVEEAEIGQDTLQAAVSTAVADTV
ncbi:MAG TPA: YicC/YloC family endoribonuclease, partial [Burkholderiaceae bacterium]|nr:YicC/YloC family endoribonuclease [Burkholderiaceae bacterium]